jgi:hypothetical protein
MPNRTPTIHLNLIGGRSKGAPKEDLWNNNENGKEE